MRFVLDNSVSMRWLLQDGSRERLVYADKVLGQLEQEGSEAVVPNIWPLEVANVILKAEAHRVVDEARAAAYISLLDEMSIRVDDSTAARALGDTLQLARRFKLSSCDASYLELALREGLPLATLDADLQKAMQKTGVALV